jgi:hypothetical protein
MMPPGGPTHPPRITEHGAPGGSDPPGIAERWHRNLPSPAKERNPGVARCRRGRTRGARIAYGTYIVQAKTGEAPQEITRIIDFTFRFPMPPDAALSCLVDIGGSMGTVPRQESVSINSSMRHRELLKWHCHVICFIFSARARRPTPRAYIFKEASCYF